MQHNHTFSVSTQLYNRLYSPDAIQARTLMITLTVDYGNEVDTKHPLGNIETEANNLKTLLHKGQVISITDPFLIRLLEPKSGNTVHKRLDQLKADLVGYTYELIGTKIPPETVNGYRVLILGDAYTVTLEGLAVFLLKESQTHLSGVTISDGSSSVFVSSDDV